MPKGKGYGRKKSGNSNARGNSKSIVPDGRIAGKKVKTPRTRRPAPKKHKP